MAGSFVTQHHRCDEGDHYDWMLEAGDSLITFRLPVPLDDMPVGRAVSIRRLSDHRRRYLTYEGPISGGRGEVRIDDRGTYETAGDPTEAAVVHLAGERVSGGFSLQRIAGDEYRLTPTGSGRAAKPPR